MALLEGDKERAESYRVLADIFFGPPDAEDIGRIREDLDLESEDTADDIASDFNSLFAYPGGDLPPLESLNSGGTNVADSVTEFYYGTGLTFDEEYEALPDHISVEFLFMSYLIDIDNRELQQRFLEQHIANWVPYYCEQVTKQAKTLFYREIAGIAKDFVEFELEGAA